MNFALDITNWAKEVNGNLTTVVGKFRLEIFRRVIMRTPVGNPDLWKTRYKPPGYVGGRARANWMLGPDLVSATTDAVDPDGQSTIDAAMQASVQVPPSRSVFIQNHLPYIVALEYGHSQRQAPNGMVRVTLAEMHAIFDSVTGWGNA